LVTTQSIKTEPSSLTTSNSGFSKSSSTTSSSESSDISSEDSSYASDSSHHELSFSAVFWTTTTTTTTTTPAPEVPCRDIHLDEEQRVTSFTSPYYPAPYPANYHCNFRITAPKGKRINLSFETLKVQHSDKCIYDYVQIEGLQKYFGVKMCGNKLPPSWMTLMSTGNTVEITFHTDGVKEMRGFKMFVNTI